MEVSTYRKARCRALCQSQHYLVSGWFALPSFLSKLDPLWLNSGSNTAVK